MSNKNVLDFFLSHLNEYYASDKFLLLYEGIPITFSELGILERKSEQRIRIRKILRKMFGTNEEHYDQSERLITDNGRLITRLRHYLIESVYTKLTTENDIEQIDHD